MTRAAVIVKGTRLCNLRCSYCNDWRAGRGQTMTFQVLAHTIAKALRDPSHDSVDFIWHGGETTLLKRSFYEKAMLLQAKFRRPGQAVSNLLQTNGTRLTPEWARFLRANQISVGVSLDGPPEIHDHYRRYASGRATFGDVGRGIQVLREHSVPFAVLMVIDDAALQLGPDRIFDFFLEHEIKSYGLIPVRPSNQPEAPPGTWTEHYADPTRMNAFYARMYDRWVEHGDPTIRIRELDAIRRRLEGKPPSLCTLSGTCMGRYYLVNPDGRVEHCAMFIGDERYSLGSIVAHDFGYFRSSEKMLDRQGEKERALTAMRRCPDFGICNGWCPHQRYLSVRHNPNHQAGCCGLRPLIEHIRVRMVDDG